MRLSCEVTGNDSDLINVSGLILAAGSDNWNSDTDISLSCESVESKHNENSEYEINLTMTVNGDKVQPQSPIIISVAANDRMTDAADKGGLKIWHYKDSGEREAVDYDLIDGQIVFRATELSDYVITEALSMTDSDSVYIPSYLNGKDFTLICTGLDSRGKMMESIIKSDVEAGESVDLTWKESGISSYRAFVMADGSFMPLTESSAV